MTIIRHRGMTPDEIASSTVTFTDGAGSSYVVVLTTDVLFDTPPSDLPPAWSATQPPRDEHGPDAMHYDPSVGDDELAAWDRILHPQRGGQ